MTSCDKTVEALQCKGLSKECDTCEYGYRLSPDSECNDACDRMKLENDAADAIEELEDALADECSECDYLVNENARLTTENKELQAQLPKRGEWIYEDLDDFRKYKVTCPHCGAWYVGNYDAYDEPSEFLYCPHCGNICNPANLDWENELKEREKEAMAKKETQE